MNSKHAKSSLHMMLIRTHEILMVRLTSLCQIITMDIRMTGASGLANYPITRNEVAHMKGGKWGGSESLDYELLAISVDQHIDA